MGVGATIGGYTGDALLVTCMCACSMLESSQKWSIMVVSQYILFNMFELISRVICLGFYGLR